MTVRQIVGNKIECSDVKNVYHLTGVIVRNSVTDTEVFNRRIKSINCVFFSFAILAGACSDNAADGPVTNPAPTEEGVFVGMDKAAAIAFLEDNNHNYRTCDYNEQPEGCPMTTDLQPGRYTVWFSNGLVDHIDIEPEFEDIDDPVTSVGEDGESVARCEALSAECGYGYDYQKNMVVDLWELSSDGSYWLLKKEFEDVGMRCEALTESCGWRWFPNTESYIDVWVFDYGSMEFIENPDLSSIPTGLQPGDPPVNQPGRES